MNEQQAHESCSSSIATCFRLWKDVGGHGDVSEEEKGRRRRKRRKHLPFPPPSSSKTGREEKFLVSLLLMPLGENGAHEEGARALWKKGKENRDEGSNGDHSRSSLIPFFHHLPEGRRKDGPQKRIEMPSICIVDRAHRTMQTISECRACSGLNFDLSRGKL